MKSKSLNKQIRETLIDNKYYIVLAFMLICSASLIFPGLYSMILAFVLIAIYKIKHGLFSIKYSKLFVWFLVAYYVSILAYLQVDYHILLFTFLIVVCTPFMVSYKNFMFERKLISTVLFTFPAVALICLYCYLSGINAFNPDFADAKELDTSFSAIYPHPMWLAPVVGLSDVVLLWSILKVKGFVGKVILIGLLLLSMYVTVVAGSRTAFFSSVISMSVVLFYNMRNVKKGILYLLVAGSLLTISAPIYYEHSTQMQNKFEAGKNYKYGSRTMHFEEGFKHLQDSPLIGSGFATAWYANNRLVLGRLESGSGWLSILFQLGVFGIFVMGCILVRVKRVTKYLKTDGILQLFVFSTLFICLHSCFEGYILTVGYYIGVIFWLLMGHLSVYPEMVKKYNIKF